MMQSNAWRALHELGVADELRATHMEIERCCCKLVKVSCVSLLFAALMRMPISLSEKLHTYNPGMPRLHFW